MIEFNLFTFNVLWERQELVGQDLWMDKQWVLKRGEKAIEHIQRQMEWVIYVYVSGRKALFPDMAVIKICFSYTHPYCIILAVQ